MPIQSRLNQYLGVNAHLQSHYQAEGGWPAFHDNHITHLQEMLGDQLEPYGYIVDNAASLQVRYHDPTPQFPDVHFEKPDVAIREHRTPKDIGASHTAITAPQVLVLSIPEASGLDEKQFLRALAIREAKPKESQLGRIVTWIEILSPSNKPGGQDWNEYAGKRLSIIAAGIPLVEVDYLHKQPPVIAGLPRYRANVRKKLSADPAAKAYNIAITDPRPTLYTGRTQVYPFGVDEHIPQISIPLSGNDTLPFDFGLVYNRTFSLSAHYLLVNYEQPPVEFKTYTAKDQARIRNRMALIVAHRHELDHGPFANEALEGSKP